MRTIETAKQRFWKKLRIFAETLSTIKIHFAHLWQVVGKFAIEKSVFLWLKIGNKIYCENKTATETATKMINYLIINNSLQPYAENDPCPEGWRVPTQEEWTALYNAGVSDWINRNGVHGRYFGTYPHQIFLPATGGFRTIVGRLAVARGWGYYWSSSNSEKGSEHAWDFHFNSARVSTFSRARVNGLPVRCVSIE